MKDDFDKVFKGSIDTTPAPVKAPAVPRQVEVKKKVFKKLSDYTSKEDKLKVKKFKDEVDNNELLKANHQKLVDTRLLKVYNIVLSGMFLIAVIFFIYAVYEGKFQSNYENNVTVKPSISCPATTVANQYDFAPIINSTCHVEIPDINCNCGNSS